MKTFTRLWVLPAAVLGLILPASAEVEMAASVVANGGGRMMGPTSVVCGTLGQAAVGVVSGPSWYHEIGFWYRPVWDLTDVGVEETPLETPFRLGPNHPNPFNPSTTLEFSIPSHVRVTIKIYDVNGREVLTAVDEDLGPGRYTRVLDFRGLASGIYFSRMTAGRYVESRKMVLLK